MIRFTAGALARPGRSKSRLIGLAFGLAVLVAGARPARAQLSVAEVAETVSPAIVNVKVLFEVESSSARGGGGVVHVQRPGCGMIVSPGGLVVTNAHLVDEVRDEGEYWLSVTLADGRRVGAAIVARDERTDLALLQLDVPDGARLPSLVLSAAEAREVGARVVAVSAPDGANAYVFAGSLAFASGPVQLREALLEPREVLLSDARFHDLLDGGPLVDTQGRVLGIHNSSHLSPLPLGFDKEAEDSGEVVDTDYAVIVSSDAIQRAFATRLDPPAPPARGRAPGDATAAIDAVAASVVSVWAGDADEHPELSDPVDPQGQRIDDALGSGVVVDPTGLVLTSSDLFGLDVKSASVRLADGSRLDARLVAKRPEEKLALLQVELPADRRLAVARLADSSRAVVGEPVAAVARPFTAALTTSVGVLSALEREGLLQVASWVHPGHYGGALVDVEGRVLGIAVKQRESAKRVDERSYMGFAAPIAAAVEAFSDEWPGAEAALAEHRSGGGGDDGARRTPVVRVAERTRSSLINVLIEKAPVQPPGGFDPFGSDDVEREYKLRSQGSGVVIDASGLALSNWHVVDSALQRDGSPHPDYRIRVTLPDGRSYAASVLSTSRDDDLSLLALELAPGELLEPVELGDSEALRSGDPLVAIGNALGLSDSVSAGVVSVPDIGTRIQGRLFPYDHMIMTDAAINPGNSGGALLDLEGRLIGINTAGRTGMGMAIPVAKAREVFRDKLLSASRLRTVYLGLGVEEQDGGLRVARVDADGPAARAGARVDDVLLSLGAARVVTVADFARRSLELETTAVCPARLERNGAVVEVELRPMPYVAWQVLAQSGIELEPVDYRAESDLVRRASVALHRSYTQDPDAHPSRLMASALRVVRVRALQDRQEPSLEPGDLLLGVTARRNGDERLVRLEMLEDVRSAFAPLATREGDVCTCWLWRDGEIVLTRVFVRRPPR